jgi:hypothetical protein
VAADWTVLLRTQYEPRTPSLYCSPAMETQEKLSGQVQSTDDSVVAARDGGTPQRHVQYTCFGRSAPVRSVSSG